MKPDRSNYESWLSEWLDGKLTGPEAEQFRSFLDENPDLKEEAEFLSHSHLSPGNESWPGKTFLKKTPAELLQSQVEYLSVAYLENDLTKDQIDDLRQNISQNSESWKLFDTLQKIRLTPLPVRYSHKELLKKPVPGAAIIRLSYIGLSAAATVALVILSYILVPRLLPEKRNVSILDKVPPDEPDIINTQVFNAPTAEIKQFETKINRSETTVPQTVLSETDNHSITAVAGDSTFRPGSTVPGFRIDTLPHFNFALKPEIFEYHLAASAIDIKKVLYEDERNGLSKFLARTFRERILKEETGSDAPVKPYEIASAGINGLNRLFGWDMALVRINGEEGELKSIYFSSRILKFNAPVKKSEPAE